MERSKAGKVAKKPARRTFLRAGVIGLAIAVALVAWLVTRGGDDDGGGAEPAPASFEAKVVDEGELSEIVAEAGHDVYWAGPIDGTELEASEGEDGGVQVRYLQDGQEPGSDPNGTLTIGSYPLADAAGALEGFAGREGAIVRRASDGTEVVSSAQAPSSVYFASPDGSLQVEVYDPSPERAMALATSGDVQPVD